MADAYIRYTVNGVRHSGEGSGTADCMITFDKIKNGVGTGFMTQGRLANLGAGDIVLIEFVRRHHRSKKGVRKELRGSVKFVIISKIPGNNTWATFLKCSKLDS